MIDDANGDFVLMDYGGESVRDRFFDEPASFDDVLPVLRQAADALDYLHGNDVVHGDVSSGNVLIHRKHGVQLTDFGLAEVVHMHEATHGMTRMALAHGYQPTYSAPEVRDRGRVLPRSDQFSLATVVSAMLQGVRAFEMRDGYRDPAGLSESALSVLRRARAEQREERFDSCKAFARAFAEAVA